MISAQCSYLIDLFGTLKACCCMLIGSHFKAESAWITIDLMQGSWSARLGRKVRSKTRLLQAPRRAHLFGWGRTTNPEEQRWHRPWRPFRSDVPSLQFLTPHIPPVRDDRPVELPLPTNPPRWRLPSPSGHVQNVPSGKDGWDNSQLTILTLDTWQ